MYSIEYNDRVHNARAMMISIFNVPITSRKVVLTDEWDVADGKVTYIQVARFGALGRFIYSYKAMKRRVAFTPDDPKNTMDIISSARVRHINGVPIWASLDGKLIQAADWNIEVVRQGLKLVVPAGGSDGQ